MRLTVTLPADVLRETLRNTGAKSPAEAIRLAVLEYNRQERRQRLLGRLGKSSDFMTQDELRRLRGDEDLR